MSEGTQPPVDRITGLLSAVNAELIGDVTERLVLLGAGASAEAGLPMSEGLHRHLAQQDLPIYQHLAAAIDAGGSPDVERFFRALDHLRDEDDPRSLAFDFRRAIYPDGERPDFISAAGARDEITKILHDLRHLLWTRPTLLGAILDPPTRTRSAYLAPLVTASLGGTIATLNYDNAVEDCGVSGVWTTHPDGGNRVLVPKVEERRVRLLKLHGSLDWRRHRDDVYRGVDPLSPQSYEPAVVFGAGNKLRYFGPFLDLIREFKDSLMAARVVVTVGYGFRDDHINEAIRHWAANPWPGGRTKNLIVRTGEGATQEPAIVTDWLSHQHLKLDFKPEGTAAFIERAFAER